MRIWSKLRHYHIALGPFGVAAFLRCKLLGKRSLYKVSVSEIGHPVYVRIGTTDVSTFRQVLMEKHYDVPVKCNPKLIIDAGANIGLSAIYFANKFPGATIIAIEPEASNFEVLKRNVAPYPAIKPFNAALWRETGKIALIDPGMGHHGFQTVNNGNDGRMVEAVTVDSLMNSLGIDFVDILKIDIEGAEKEIFESSGPWMDKVGIVMAELHDNIKPGCSGAFAEATKNLPTEFSRGEIIARARRS